jgi:glycosyltransferase involved in cell wall biosynthesis
MRLSVKFRYDLIQVHNMPDYLVFFGIFHKLLSRPVILDLHDLSPELFSSRWGKGIKGKILSPIVNLIERISCSIANHLITTSNGFYNNLVSRGTEKQKITLVFNSANEKIFKLSEPRKWESLSEGVKIIYHGTIVKRFGLHIAIEAVSKLRNDIPGLQFWLYGRYDEDYKRELEQMVENLQLKDTVSLLYSIPWEGIVKKIEEADFGVVPYLSDEFMNLALSTKTFEYVAMNLPVVASKVDSIASIFDDKGVSYFKPGDAEGLAKNILELSSNPEKRKSLVQNAADQYKDYSWPVMSARYTNLVSGLIGNHK